MVFYTLSFAQYYQHLIKVTVQFEAKPQQKIWLPTWIPGSYLIREFSRHIEAVVVECIQSESTQVESNADQPNTKQSISIKKISKNQWQLDNAQVQQVQISYLVYAFDLSVRGAYVDDDRIYVNPAAVCVAIDGQQDDSIQLKLDIPEALQHFSLASSSIMLKTSKTEKEESHLTKKTTSDLEDNKNQSSYRLQAQDYYTLIDQPFELAAQQWASFKAKNISHRVAISGRHSANLTRLTSDLEKICAAQIKLFGDAPFKDYLFMVMATAAGYGGLEHQNSTSLITPRDDLPKQNEGEAPSIGYQRFLGLCSHEYFHSWLVKFIRPHNFVKPDLNQEAYTTLLWVFEGITSYYDDLMLYRCGVINQAAYIDLLKEQVSRYLANAGRHMQSVADSSFDAWIKFYRPDENSNNANTSYYNKGALIALCLDLTLRQHGSCLNILLQTLYQHAKQGKQVQEDTLVQLCQQLSKQNMDEFFNRYVYGTEELPLEQLLTEVGLDLKFENKAWPLGLKVQENPQGLLVQQVLRHSAAAMSGLSSHDVIVAIDGLKATNSLLQQLHSSERVADETNQQTNHQISHQKPEKYDQQSDEQHSLIVLHAFRGDELRIFKIKSKHDFVASAKLEIANQASLSKWLDN